MTDDQRAIVDALCDSLDDGFTLMPETVALCEGIEVVQESWEAAKANLYCFVKSLALPALA